ncbi:MAG: nucleotidyltransferase family protein [Oscillospiraceae bacterium]
MAKLCCILLACGQGKRFGENKLLQRLGNKTLVEIAIDTIPRECFEKIILVTKYKQVADIAASKGVITILSNDDEIKGISVTIKKGMGYVDGTDGCMFGVCDQPLRTSKSIIKMIELFNQNEGSIVALGHNGKRGNPVLFHKNYYEELKNLSGDNSGGFVVKNHIDKLILCEVQNEKELLDIDTKQDLEKIKEIIFENIK